MMSFGGTPYGKQEYDEVVEKLEKGYRLPCPKEIENISSWSPRSLYNNISSLCFASEPKERPAFFAILQIIEKHLGEDEKAIYKQMFGVYENKTAVNYLRLGDSKAIN